MRKKVKKAMGYLALMAQAIFAIIKTVLNGKRSHAPKLCGHTPILIMGNGPSLKELNLIALSKKLSLACVNWFAVQNDFFRELKPGYYILMDGEFFGSEDRLNDKKKENRRRLFKELNAVDWDMTIIIPQKNRPALTNPHIKYEMISTASLCNDHIYTFMNYLYSKNLAICGMQNVLAGALHYFIMKRFREIYIAGVDMSEFQVYHVDGRNHVLAEYTHFYGTDYIDCTETGSIPKGEFYRWMGYYARMLKEFYCIKQFADYQKASVINLTENSFIDVFEKRNWKELADG